MKDKIDSLLDAAAKSAQAAAQTSALSRSDIRRIIAFDRFLARLFFDTNAWYLKGSYALESRLKGRARPAADIDLSYSHSARIGDGNFPDDLHESSRDIGDGFSYSSQLLEDRSKEIHAINYGLCRLSVACKYEGSDFAQFQVDVSLCRDCSEDEAEKSESFNFLSQLSSFGIRQLPITVQFAEKAHAYSLPLPPYGTDPHWKAKHLADLLLIIENGVPSADELARDVPQVFLDRGTHDVPVVLPHIQTYRGIQEAFQGVTEHMALSTKDYVAAYSKVSQIWTGVIDAIIRNRKLFQQKHSGEA